VSGIVDRLRAAQQQATPSVLLVREAADEIERLQRALDQAHAHARQLAKDMREEATSSAAEATWRERQVGDYGSY
jgi:F0F1-type ATP synthase membrane subunit b/b'